MNHQQSTNLDTLIVSCQQMTQIEERIFAAGMPQAALMEKAAGLCFRKIRSLYPLSRISTVGVLVGAGHNGGDALVIARELYFAGYRVKIYCPFDKQKKLTTAHRQYAQNLGIPFADNIASLKDCQLIIDGLFGFGLNRDISGDIALDITNLNSWRKQVISIDLPSGIHTDRGFVLGVAVKATYTLCLGLWKRAFFQDHALEYIGTSERLDFGIPIKDVLAVIAKPISPRQITPNLARKFLPLSRPINTHKYQQGHLLLISGSLRYSGAAILSGLGARASGVGMLTIAVPESLKPLLVSHLPEALVIGCSETKEGTIASLPISEPDLNKFDAISCGCGITQDAESIVKRVLNAEIPLILDADALNLIAQLGSDLILQRKRPTILTPHWGEFKRLFPDLECFEPDSEICDRISAVEEAARQSRAIVLLKGAKSAIASPDGKTWIVPKSTPALARGGSGDILTGLIGGLIAQVIKSKNPQKPEILNTVASAAWWHAMAGIVAAKERTQLGVDPLTCYQYLIRSLREL